MAKVLAGLCVLLIASNAYANSILAFAIGIPEEITLVVGVPTAIPAAIINIRDTPLSFGCAHTGCGGIEPAVPFSPGAFGAFLSQVEGPSGGSSYLDQFVGLVLAPDERFDFTLMRLTLNSDPGMPFSVTMAFGMMSSALDFITQSPNTPVLITPGDLTSISALTFIDRHPPTVPEGGSVLPLAAIALALMLRHGVTNGCG